MTNPTKIVCLAVDDEPPALDILKKYIAAISSLELAGTCNNAIEASNALRTQKIDLLFLDIQMPQLLGTDLVRTLKNPPRIIFTTAHRKFALEGFELDAVDYLLKPISFERFLKAVNKVMDVSLQQNQQSQQIQAPALPSPEPAEPFIHFRADRKMMKIALDDILYIESLKDYVKVVTRSRTIITKQSISSLEDNLPKDAFIRIHRSYIVSLSKVESYTNELIEIAKQELPISRMYRLEVEKALRRP